MVLTRGTLLYYVLPYISLSLSTAGDVCLGGKQLRESGGHFNDKWKPTEFDTKRIFVSPSVKYAGHQCYAKSTRYFPVDLLFFLMTEGCFIKL